jgi:hypothetical protein
MLAPIDVNEKRQLYCLMFFMNFLDVESPSNVANEANGSGRAKKRGITTLPPLQQLLYTILPERWLESRPILSACQNTA